ncbi:MAG: TrmH family RNA methyltransferase [Gammaproteobacteria bacterium]|nr:TrmH family RNA methyltransferase [Gammaproteobacteria bacterium]
MSGMQCGHQLNSQQLLDAQKSKQNADAGACTGTIVASDIRTPENLGAIYRLADAAGINNIVVINEAGANCFADKKLKKISRDAVARLNIKYLTEAEFLKSSNEYQPLVAIEICTHSEDLFSSQLPGKCSFVVGNERHGIAEALLDVCVKAIHIPMYGVNGSMNVSHALAICLYEWRRQHEQEK